MVPTKADITRLKRYDGKKSYAERISQLEAAKDSATSQGNFEGARKFQKDINAIKIIAAEAPPFSAKKPPRSAMKAPPKSAKKAPKSAAKAPKSAAKAPKSAAKAPKSAVKATPKNAKAPPTPIRRSTRSNTPAKSRDN